MYVRRIGRRATADRRATPDEFALRVHPRGDERRRHPYIRMVVPRDSILDDGDELVVRFLTAARRHVPAEPSTPARINSFAFASVTLWTPTGTLCLWASSTTAR